MFFAWPALELELDAKPSLTLEFIAGGYLSESSPKDLFCHVLESPPRRDNK